MKTFTSILVMLSSFFLASHADAFRCNGYIISSGDLISKVNKTCGEPTERDTRQKEMIQRRSPPDEVRAYVTVETWVYDKGPQDLLQFLRFENDVLASIWTGDYGGSKAPNPDLCNASEGNIKPGRDQLEVRMKCGEPIRKLHVEDRITSATSKANDISYPSQSTVTMIEEWTYTFDPQKPETVLRFENGSLSQIMTRLK